MENTWEVLPVKPMAAYSGPVVYMMEDNLFVAGHNGPYVEGKTIETITEKLSLDAWLEWTREPASPTHDVSFTNAVVIGNTTYICAGTYYEKTKAVISWTYGQPAWTPVADMNIARSTTHGTVTDGVSNIWVVGGCDPDDCWPDGFIEHYSVITKTWTKLNHVPDIEKDTYRIEVCAFWRGYIYVIFHGSGVKGLILDFHVYNTKTGVWHTDGTQLERLSYGSMSGIIS